MSDITINNDESQSKNQKTTPVKKSLNGYSRPASMFADTIMLLWQG
ncbi:hypothetical protein KC867_03835 [Candidatus Saccharibacteria bacterium]|nr:hypothetical protein [Candidatus Saccharibacteria bacterium]